MRVRQKPGSRQVYWRRWWHHIHDDRYQSIANTSLDESLLDEDVLTAEGELNPKLLALVEDQLEQD